jgi:hypothetical protein
MPRGLVALRSSAGSVIERMSGHDLVDMGAALYLWAERQHCAQGRDHDEAGRAASTSGQPMLALLSVDHPSADPG